VDESQGAQQPIDELEERLRDGGFAVLTVDEKAEPLELQGVSRRS